jgi:hypothetical protein
MRGLVILSIVLMPFSAGVGAQEPLIVTERAAVILNPVKPDSTEEFELGLAQLRAALAVMAASPHPAKRQKAHGWKIYRAEEPLGTNVLYVFFLNPALPYGDYSFKTLLEESLPPPEAEVALRRLSGSLAGAQTVISLTPTPARDRQREHKPPAEGRVLPHAGGSEGVGGLILLK